MARPLSGRFRLFILCVLVGILVFPYACGRDSDTVVVDFSKTAPVQRPELKSQGFRPLRVAVGAMVSPKETFIYYRQLLDYIGGKLGREVELVQRKTYVEINELLGNGQIDFAFVCSGPYATGRTKYNLELLATPQVQGSHFYRSYLIVNRASSFQGIEDLRGRSFAFTDPDSNTGKLVPTYWVARMGERPEGFFGKIIYTYSHDNSISATAKGLVDGAAVDGLIWDYYHRKNPAFVSLTRVVMESDPYGIPPLVSSPHVASELKERTRQVLFSMHQESEGRRILDELTIEKFIAPEEDWYEPIRRMQAIVSSMAEKPHASDKP